MTGPRELNFTASAHTSRIGEISVSPMVAPTRSKLRLTMNWIPSNTGGRSVNSGTDSPGENSARSNRISIVVGATCTVIPR